MVAVTQRVPTVTRADVERVIRRDYPSQDPAVVVEILDDADTRGRHRVQLAALKLADGDLAQLREHIRMARRDYRDVLAAAEYPLAMARWREIDKMSDEARDSIHDADWKQYQAWLKRS